MPAKKTTLDIPAVSAAEISAYLSYRSEPSGYAGIDRVISTYSAAIGDRELPAPMAAALALNDRAATFTTPEPAEGTDTTAVVMQLLKGEITAEEAARQAAEAEAAQQGHKAAEEMVKQAKAAARIGAVKCLRQLTEDDALPPLRAQMDTLLARSRELAPLVSDIDTDAGTLRVSEDKRSAWLELGRLRERVVTVVQASAMVRTYTGPLSFKIVGHNDYDTDSPRYGYLAELIGPNERSINDAVAGSGIGFVLRDARKPGEEVAAFASAVTNEHVKLGVYTAAEAKANYYADCKTEHEARQAEIAAEPQRRGMVNAATAGGSRA